ncbi:UDP-3-O-acyl-N-acetylglucosamine deacetylase [Oceanicola sp. D3]|uniref:UDP-3-O-acyl-N-acetylglucosamine deacetylase n=1 Tax=Oceanicola sp. D3 TaxID=2587163 RepID=UPI001122D4FC|nr:UDP-3-O-acyl-N-acetylglucosamine deacetylase [Oceanicola sp. D3]QDC09250.1 UDP-3-O-acyl-N-acetylglucosamine deacetylase [Oceanicola sp. D3]
MQTTLNKNVTLSGVGLHSGRPARITLKPAMADQGIWFRRTDAVKGDAFLPARWDAVVESPLCTLLTNDDGVSLSTVEHVMAALAGCGVHNALIEVSGPEVPILDGSAAPFVGAILKAGLRVLDAPIRAIRVLKPVEVRRGDAVARLEPSDDSLHIDFGIDFEDAAIGAQTRSMNMANGAFVRELCDSRTFCRAADVEAMRAEGKALGGTYENAVVVEGEKVLSPGGLRHSDEPVRHKMLDALGDLALAGHPLLARYTGRRAGHALTNALLHALFADPSAFEIVTCDGDMARQLPGTGLKSRDLRLVA